MKDAPFLLALVAAFFVKSSVSELGLRNMATSLKVSQGLDWVQNAEAQRAESHGGKQRDLLQLSSPSLIGARAIEGTWVGFADPGVVEDISGSDLFCPSEYLRRGNCISDVQLTLKIDGGGFIFREGPTNCDSCGDEVLTEFEVVSGTVTAFRNNRLEVRYLTRDLLVNGVSSEEDFGEGSRDACMNMEVFVEDGRVLADFRNQFINEGNVERFLMNLINEGFSKCTSKPITCEIDLNPPRFSRARVPQESLMQCVSGKCLELAGANRVIPTSLDPCELGLPSSRFGPNPRRSQFMNRSSFINGSLSNMTATRFVALVALVVSCSFLLY